MTEQRQPPAQPSAVALTFDLIGLAQVDDRDGFNARLEEVREALELSAAIAYLRAFHQEDFVQLITARREKLTLSTLPQAQGSKGGKRL